MQRRVFQISRWHAVGLLLLLLSACGPKTMLETALRQAGGNREELERVLSHYQKDSLKYAAACFLIENMIGKGAIRYAKDETSGIYMQKKPEPDLVHITASYLIENIELAFKARERYPWCRKLSFEKFCHSVLPHRLKQEPLERWRWFYYHRYKSVADSLAASGASLKEVVFFMNARYGKKYLREANEIPGDFSYQLIEELGGGTCDHLALNAVQLMRSIGIPLDLDILPCHGKVNGGHSYNSFTDEHGHFVYFSPYEREPERNKWIAPLVQRVCYERQPKSEIDANRWNTQLSHQSLKAVTDRYYPCCSIRIPVQGQISDSILYLTTYNRGTFKVVAQSRVTCGEAFFPALPQGLLYFQMTAGKNGLNPMGDPFIVTSDGASFIAPTEGPVILNGLCLYDVKRVLKLGTDNYRLLYWNNGWQFLKNSVSTDSVTLDFGEVPVRSLYLLYGNACMERMQRPFLLKEGKVEFY
ncbi:hypothetical protein [Bacteroides fluxus]|uniref:hypothetical protein n=1 Tax=Bacteroides fluxus TaxID=626930 RepID=UPI0023A7EA60|nr:hypothetical protein [Bacteroides fluxus]